MVTGQANESTEAGKLPTEEELAQMMKYNEELVKAGVLVDHGGLLPMSRAKRVRFAGTERTVIDGPFAESKEVIAGYQILEVRSMEEAIEWVKRAPFDGGFEVTIRPLFGPDDFGEAATPELRERGEEVRAEEARRQKA
jgi:hypothetical protein